LIVSVVSYKVYTKEEINNKLEKYEILNCLNILCNYCIHRFVVDEYDILSVQYHDYFSNLDTEKIIETCDEFYSLFEVYTNPDIKKNIWNEILRCSITNYIIKLVILSENQMIKGIEDIKKKIQNDNVIFLRFYSNKIGLESTQEILKNLDYYLEFLESSPDMICLPCQSLREFNGDSFTIQKVKILMNLRFDFTAKQKQEAIETCIEVFTNCKEYKKDKNTNQLYNYIVEKRNRKKKKQNSKYEKNLESLNDDCNTKYCVKIFFLKALIINQLPNLVYFLIKFFKNYSWQSRYFQIKKRQLYWFENKNQLLALNFLDLKNIIQIISTDKIKFEIYTDKKIYELMTQTKEEKDEWISVLNQERKKILQKEKKKYDNILEIEEKKKVICDFFNLQNIEENMHYIRYIVDTSMKSEDFFKKKTEM